MALTCFLPLIGLSRCALSLPLFSMPAREVCVCLLVPCAHVYLHFPPISPQVPRSWWLGGLCASTVVCVAGTTIVFGLPWWQPLVSLALSLLVAYMAVRALGTTASLPPSPCFFLSRAIAFALPA